MALSGVVNYRAGTVADADGVARLVIEGFEEYRSFAPDGWSPPRLADTVAPFRELLAEPDVWCRLAEVGDGELAGQVTFMPASRHRHAADDPSLVHLLNLFVRREFWGTGVASALLAAAVAEARERRYAQMRLFTPAQQARARRFYEREGWAVAGDEFHDAAPNLVVVEYRRALDGP
jgi:GNAT superfamily N-acetyltransferase